LHFPNPTQPWREPIIPFTQFLRPDCRKRPVVIDHTPEIEAAAQDFIRRGGWFECEVLTTGHISLTACWDMPDGDNDIVIELCSNDEAVPDAVARLVRKAANRRDLP